MRNLYFFNMVTLDGYFEGPNREIDWHNVDDEFNRFAIDQINSTDLLLFGRVTYELMANYWPSPAAHKDDPFVAEKMNSIAKIVFSKTLKKVEWNNTRLIHENVAEEVSQLKQQPGKDIAIFGSSNLAATFIQHGLLDEYRIMVNPVVLGRGRPLFKGVEKKMPLKLVEARTFKSGNVLLYYRKGS